MHDLLATQCGACRGELPALRGEELSRASHTLGGSWRIVDEHHLENKYRFPDFRESLAFTNRVADVAEEIGHHPDICLKWGLVTVTIFTYACDAMTETDF